jgi:signal transduction histidine kinase
LLQSEKAAAIGEAVTAIQHAIKNMLNTLTGGAYLARRGMVKHDQEWIEDGFAMISEGISRIRNLSVNMLQYAKGWKPELEVTDLSSIVADISSAFKETGSPQGITVRYDVADPLPRVSCDPRLVHMALTDIATNALDACLAKSYSDEETPEIVFSLYPSESGKSVVAEITDNGIGMADETRAGIFTPFFSTKGESGTGLGLSLASRIVNLHGGEIEVESEFDKGSRFRVTLPVTSTDIK